MPSAAIGQIPLQIIGGGNALLTDLAHSLTKQAPLLPIWALTVSTRRPTDFQLLALSRRLVSPHHLYRGQRMGEIVIAYARPDEAAADKVIAKLESKGVTTRRAVAGLRSSARRLRGGAEPQIVLWSKHYAKAFLKPGRVTRAKLAARLDSAPLPGLLKATPVDLRDWRGRETHRGWSKLAQVARAVGGAAPRGRPAPTKAAPASSIKVAKAQSEKKKSGVGPALFWLTAAAATMAGGAAIYLQMH